MESPEGPAPPDPPPPAEPAAAAAPEPAAAAEPAAAPAPEPAAAPAPAPRVQSFRPTWGRRYIVAPFWAGLLGASVFSWIFAFLFSLSRAGLYSDRHIGLFFFVALVNAVIITLWRGYLDPIRSYASLFGRILGALFFGGASAGIVLAILIVIFDSLHVRDLAAFLTIALASVLFGGLALLRLYGLGTARPRRIKIAAATAALLLVTVVPASPSLRCRFGSSDACAEVAADASDRGEHDDALEYGDRGCDRGAGVACTVAGLALQRGAGSAREKAGAERFFRRGCALGDEVACGRVHEIELDKRCQRYSAFACKELADDYAHGVGVDRDMAASLRYRQKACLLGDEEACGR